MHLTEAYTLVQQPHASAENKKRLALLLNQMIVHDFESLVQLLYRVDVPEGQVAQLLQEQPQADAGFLLAGLLLERQHQKAALRKQFDTNKDDIPEADRW